MKVNKVTYSIYRAALLFILRFFNHQKVYPPPPPKKILFPPDLQRTDFFFKLRNTKSKRGLTGPPSFLIASKTAVT